MTITPTDLIEKFYTAFQKRDYAGMAACYHPEIAFQDEVFTLKGKEAPAMWHMLCEGGKDLVVTFSGVEASETTGRAHWDAHYTFSSTGRKVHNIIDAEFKFKDGLIIEHRDRFDFWRWSHQALGPTGLFLGWTPLVRNRVQRTARARLDKFIQQHPEYR
ncbi:MAG: nuclear transport factor 2 family protein [Anaerolineales bacterium]|nr:nuclear transport factor 2 family protein [Anaerolineales bacterium]